MEIREFTASDGYRLHYRFYGPQGSETPRGFVVALHGIQSHAGWYEHSSRRLADTGYEIIFLDRRGSGLNEEDRGHAPHVDRLVNDVVQLLSAVRRRRDRQAPSAPIILSAVSWGGKLAAVVCSTVTMSSVELRLSTSNWVAVTVVVGIVTTSTCISEPLIALSMISTAVLIAAELASVQFRFAAVA